MLVCIVPRGMSASSIPVLSRSLGIASMYCLETGVAFVSDGNWNPCDLVWAVLGGSHSNYTLMRACSIQHVPG